MTKTMTVLAISLLLFSCGETSSEKTNAQTETITQEVDGKDDEMQTIKLNNGEKWLVNEEMKPFILESEIILNDYIESSSTDFKTLAERLNEKNSKLIESCTMNGESHDELHKWLYPHMNLIRSLAQEENTESAASIVRELALSFETYHKYFS